MGHPIPARAGAWLPSRQLVQAQWLDSLIAEVDEEVRAGGEPELTDALRRFRQAIREDPTLYMLFTDMFWQLSLKETPTGYPQVRDVEHMLRLINKAVRTAPAYQENGLVGFPINAILNWAMGTQAGFAAFLNDKVNAHLREILNEWKRYLEDPEQDSKKVLDRKSARGWLGKSALEKMKNFEETFECDPDDRDYYGFATWDAFFTRRFRHGARPVDDPDDENVIVNACESIPYRLRRRVRLYDRFSIKGQPYSLTHMLHGATIGHEQAAEKFAGGTVYQAFLGAFHYHRWHSPVKGRVVATHHVAGAYYSETPHALCDPVAPNDSQGYLNHVATRAMVFIRADAPIGLLCFLAVGMAEVSSCEITVGVGDEVRKGDELGLFHYGGSTHCLLFRPDITLRFLPEIEHMPERDRQGLLINKRIAEVV